MSATDHTLTAPERENIEELLRLHVLADDEQIVYDLFETLLTQRGVTYEARLTTAEAEKEALRAERDRWKVLAENLRGASHRAEAAETALGRALSEMRGGLSPRAKQSLKEGAYWVRLSRRAALILLDEAPEWNAALPDEDPSLLTEAGNTLPLLHPTKKER